MNEQDNASAAAETEAWLIRRRTFVGASVAVGGAVAAMGLLDGCATETDEES